MSCGVLVAQSSVVVGAALGRRTRAAKSTPADIARTLRSRRDSTQAAALAARKVTATRRPTIDGGRVAVLSPWYGLWVQNARRTGPIVRAAHNAASISCPRKW